MCQRKSNADECIVVCIRTVACMRCECRMHAVAAIHQVEKPKVCASFFIMNHERASTGGRNRASKVCPVRHLSSSACCENVSQEYSVSGTLSKNKNCRPLWTDATAAVYSCDACDDMSRLCCDSAGIYETSVKFKAHNREWRGYPAPQDNSPMH